MVDVVELIIEAWVVVRLGAENVAVLCRIDLDAGARELIEDACGKCPPEIPVQRTRFEHIIYRKVF